MVMIRELSKLAMKPIISKILFIFICFSTLLYVSDVFSQKIMPKLVNPELVVEKSKRKLKLFDGKKLIKTYTISLGAAPIGDKEIEGDGKTPEGNFYIFTKNDKSSFFLSLGVSYPNKEDAARGLKQNLVNQTEFDEIIKAIDMKEMPLQKTKLGGEIYIHGGGCDSDWTQGCIALANEDMQEIFDIIEIGVNISIKP
jgi:murein L,D-transpeptidase YafK